MVAIPPYLAVYRIFLGACDPSQAVEDEAAACMETAARRGRMAGLIVCLLTCVRWWVRG